MNDKFEIEIVEGHDSSSYFWFHPVVITRSDVVQDDNVIEYDEEFSIEEENVDCFLRYFFCKYFDKELVYNQKRYDSCEGFLKPEFEWYLTYNFYTYDTVRMMISDILRTAQLLISDYDNPSLDEVKENFSIFYMSPPDSEDHKHGSSDAIPKYAGNVVDFYCRFSARLLTMMKNNPSANIISIMGP